MAAAYEPKPMNSPPDSKLGDFDAAFAAAPVKLDVEYTTPPQIHAQMEPHATIASWEGDGVVLYTSNQMPNRGQKALGSVLKLAPEKVRIVSPYIGGGFGAKLQVQPEATLAILASKVIQRPVKVALTRQQEFHVATHRTDTIQRIRLGADKDGKLSAISHESWSDTAEGDGFFETSANVTRSLYAAQNRVTRHRLVNLNMPIASSMRAPGEAVGQLAFECAMDELAEHLKIDPIELRVRNEPAEDPEKKVPFSTRQLVPCMREGARLFGWDKRQAAGSRREGNWLVGMGMSAAARLNPLMPSAAKVRLGSDGVLVVRMAMTDPGTGTYTILTQIAGEMLGLPPERVRVEMGDTDFPFAAGSGGSFGAGSSGSALYVACENLREALLKAGDLNPEARPSGTGRDVREPDRNLDRPRQERPGGDRRDQAGRDEAEILAVLLRRSLRRDRCRRRYRRDQAAKNAGRFHRRPHPQREDGAKPGDRRHDLRRRRGADGGCGGRFPLQLLRQPRHGRVPCAGPCRHPAIDAVFLPELDDKANPLKSKGLGELGICGAGAALANAIHNATGIRIREYPMTLDKVLKGFEEQEGQAQRRT